MKGYQRKINTALALAIGALALLAVTILATSKVSAGNVVDFPVKTQQYADPRFADGWHWIYKASYRGTDVFIDMGPACPNSPMEAAGVLGGDPNAWSLLPATNGTGWKYNNGPQFSAIVPFGKIDHPVGTSTQGQTIPGTTTVATFWCNG